MTRKLAVLALAGFLTAASVQAVPTTYQYTGNPFTNVAAPYTTSDFVSAMVTLAGPLAPNMPFTSVTPTAFTLSDGVQTITNFNAIGSSFNFATGPTGAITEWDVSGSTLEGSIGTVGTLGAGDTGVLFPPISSSGGNNFTPGTWALAASAVPDTGSTLSLMTLTLMALGVAARRFQRAAA
jgi:hypothetical protein